MKNGVFWDVTPCGSCKILNILQPYRPPRPVTRIALLYVMGNTERERPEIHMLTERGLRILRQARPSSVTYLFVL
jgi:hypothetical protein